MTPHAPFIYFKKIHVIFCAVDQTREINYELKVNLWCFAVF